MSVAICAQLAVLYEHPQWFQPLFAALDRRGMRSIPIELYGHRFDPRSLDVQARMRAAAAQLA